MAAALPVAKVNAANIVTIARISCDIKLPRGAPVCADAPIINRLFDQIALMAKDITDFGQNYMGSGKFFDKQRPKSLGT